MKTWKKYLLSLAATVLLWAAMTPAAFAAFDGTYIDYRAWSQDQLPWGIQYLGDRKVYGAFNNAGCLVVSFAKLAVQAGVREPGAEFNPAVVNQLFEAYDVTNTSGLMITAQRGTAASLVGLTYEKEISVSEIQRYLQETDKNYMVILYKNGHFVPIDKATSLATGSLYYHESWKKSGNRESSDYNWVAATYATNGNDADYYIQNMISKNYTTVYGTPAAVWLLSAPYHTCTDFTKQGVCKECNKTFVPALSGSGAFMDIVDINDKGVAPAHVTPYGAADTTNEYKKGDTVFVWGSGTNAFGNTWYQLSSGEWLSEKYLGTHIHCWNENGCCTHCMDGTLSIVRMNLPTLPAESEAFPVHYAPYGASAKYTTVSGSVTVSGKVVNAYGNVWYSLGSGGWIWGDYVDTTGCDGYVNLSTDTLALNDYCADSSSGQSRQLAELSFGSEVYVYTNETAGNWYSVYSYSTNMVGFVPKRYITLKDDGKFVEPPHNSIEPPSEGTVTPPSGGDQPSTPSGTVSLSYPTDPTYAGKFAVSDTSATVVANITKPAGSHVSACGVLLYDSSSNLIKDHRETVTNVGDSLTSFHAWYEIESEMGITLTPGTTYLYNIYAVVDGLSYLSETLSFTTTTPPVVEPPQETVFTVSGTVSGGSGATVTAGGVSVEAGADGSFSVNTTESAFDVTVKRLGCLTYTVQNVTPNGADVDLGTITLLAGDVDGNDLINARDINGFRKEFGKSGEAIGNMAADMNGDGNVNARDINVLRKNFGKSAAKDCTFRF